MKIGLGLGSRAASPGYHPCRCATSLYEVLHVRKQHLAMEYALSAIQQIGLGIFYLHQCTLPVLHLDLKSANVLLGNPNPNPNPSPTLTLTLTLTPTLSLSLGLSLSPEA